MAADFISYESIGIKPRRPIHEFDPSISPKEAAFIEYERIDSEIRQAILDGRIPDAGAGRWWRMGNDGLTRACCLNPEPYAAQLRALSRATHG